MAVQAKPLTNTEVKAAKAIGKDLSLHDGGGLLLFVKTSGVKTWRFRYYHPVSKKRTTITFGNYPALSLAEARQKREEVKRLLAKKIDPQEYQRTVLASEQEARINNLEKVAADWFKIKQSSVTENYARDIWRSLERDIFPAIGHIGIQKIKARTLITALEPVKTRGALDLVKRITQRLNQIMIFAVNCGLIDANPAGGISHAFEKPKKKNMPTLTPKELPEFMQALSVASIELQTRLLIEWQLLTITRPAEAAGAMWSEINYDLREWQIPAERMKMRRDHVIHLSSQALAILDVMKPISAHKKYLFPSSKHSFQSMSSQTVNASIKRMGYDGRLVAHGMRAIASTALNEKGFSPDVIEAALSHVDTNEVRRAYNRSTYLEQRKVLMDWWGKFVERAATGKFTAAEIVRRIKGESDKLRTIEFK